MNRLCFLGFWILTFRTVALQSTRYALQGGMVTFEPDIKTLPDEILWKHNGNKVVEFNGKKETVYSPFKERITLDWHAAALQINELSHSDSGEYELNVFTKKGVNRFSFKLDVMDRLAKPTIFCKMNNDHSSSDKSGNEATLTCSADSKQSQPLTFEWSQHGKTFSGPTLKILLGKEHDDEVYSCIVSNRLSNEMATFTAKDCYLVNSPAGLSAGQGAAIGLLVLLCVLVIVGVLYCKLKHKAFFAKEKTNDVEGQTCHDHTSEHISDGASKPLLDKKPMLPPSQRGYPLPGMIRNKKNIQNDEGDTESNEDTGTGIVSMNTRKYEQNQQPEENNKDNKTHVPLANKSSLNGNLAQNVEGETDTDPHTDHSEEHSGATQSDLQPLTASEPSGLESSKDGAKKIGPPVPKKRHSFRVIKGQADVNALRENKVSVGDGLEEYGGATESDPQSSTASETPGLESSKDEAKKIGPPVPKKRHSFRVIKEQADVNALRDNKVSERDGLEEHGGATESDLQSSTASETPGLESSKDEPKKIKPPVPKKRQSVRHADVNALRDNKVSECDGLEEHGGATESDLQSSTASETPELEKELNKI